MDPTHGAGSDASPPTTSAVVAVRWGGATHDFYAPCVGSPSAPHRPGCFPATGRAGIKGRPADPFRADAACPLSCGSADRVVDRTLFPARPRARVRPGDGGASTRAPREVP
ncbi:hypothetical protein NLS1_27790 [Nocardioides sp. LS1]|nr:hypothetical protein NLS1_27790 [Nocardioides sp. LS1]